MVPARNVRSWDGLPDASGALTRPPRIEQTSAKGEEDGQEDEEKKRPVRGPEKSDLLGADDLLMEHDIVDAQKHRDEAK